MSPRARLNCATAAWFLLAWFSAWRNPDNAHHAISGVIVILGFVDRSLRLILAEMRARNVEAKAEPEATRSPMPHWRDKDRPGYTPVRHPLPPIGGIGRSP